MILPIDTAANEVPVNEENRAVSVGDFILTPGRVETKGWSADRSVQARFTLERKDKKSFADFNIVNITAELNGQPVTVDHGKLDPDTKPIKVLLMIDKSGSMNVSRESYGVNKLAAAKESLRYFIDKLAPDDEAALVAFNLEPEPIVALTNDKNELKRGIDQISAGGDTAIYNSIDYAQTQARNNNMKSIIFMSDGKDAPGLYKQPLTESEIVAKESTISDVARQTGIPIFSIALGDKADKETLGGVDFDTMDRISRNSNGGAAALIDIPTINQATFGDPAQVNSKLVGDLKDVLIRIKGQLKFGFEQPIKLPNLQEGSGSLFLKITLAEGEKQTVFRVEYPYLWEKKSIAPTFFPTARVVNAHVTILINTKPSGIAWPGLVQIYLLLLLSLCVLALFPSVINRVIATHATQRMKNAIEVVGRSSPLLGKQCPNEIGAGERRYQFVEGDRVIVCPKCNTPHHLSCWEYNQHQCMNRVCEYGFTIPDRLLDKYKLIPEEKKRFV